MIHNSEDQQKFELFLVAGLGLVLIAGELFEPLFVQLGLAVLLGIAVGVLAWPRTTDHDVTTIHSVRGAGSLVWGMFIPVLSFPFIVMASVPLFLVAMAALRAVFLGFRLWHLSGVPLPADGQAEGRVVFKGKLYALAKPQPLPLLDDKVALWIARQGWWRKWSSEASVELRDGQRRVRLDPRKIIPYERPWLPSKRLSLDTVEVLPGANEYDYLRVWDYEEGTELQAIGNLCLSDDPEVFLFSTRPVITRSVRIERQDVKRILYAWGTLAIGAVLLSLRHPLPNDVSALIAHASSIVRDWG